MREKVYTRPVTLSNGKWSGVGLSQWEKSMSVGVAYAYRVPHECTMHTVFCINEYKMMP